jgi:hypothetical protein
MTRHLSEAARFFEAIAMWASELLREATGSEAAVRALEGNQADRG